jgi:hypothetical protein
MWGCADEPDAMEPIATLERDEEQDGWVSMVGSFLAWSSEKDSASLPQGHGVQNNILILSFVRSYLTVINPLRLPLQ